MYTKDSISNFIKIIFFLVIFGWWSNQAQAYTVLGTGSGALLGGDLTDPENNGVDGSNTNWNWTSINASSENILELGLEPKKIPLPPEILEWCNQNISDDNRKTHFPMVLT